MSAIRDKMEKTIQNTKSHLMGIRTGRANPDLLSKIVVDYYGSHVPLQQLASVSVPENMVIMVNVFDKGAVQNVEKAIQMSGLGLTPNTEGSIIRLRLPELTEARRLELVKQIKKIGEDAKVAVRNVRRDFIDSTKEQLKNKAISEDESKQEQESIQKLTDSYVHKVDELIKAKESEIMTF